MSLTNQATDVRWWIVSALIVALIVGDTGHAPTIAMITLMVMMCVSLQGLNFKKADIIENKKAVAAGIFICYVVAGGVTLIIGSFYDHELWLGWVMIAAVPCAISVTSATLLLKGDTKTAMITVTFIYVIALAVTPLMTKVLIGEAVSPFEVLKYVALFIIIPFGITIPLRKFSLDPKVRGISINILFFMLIFITFGANKEFILNEPSTVLWVLAGCIVKAAAVALTMEFLLKWIKVKRDQRVTMVLLSTWKNSALAMSMTMILISTTHSVLPSALSLPLEMVWFMFMMWYYSKRCPPAPDGPGHCAQG
jgi:BASS family bile acid:Na+ symporter